MIAQKGDRLAYVVMGGLGSVDTDAMEEITETAVGKLKSATSASATKAAPTSSAPSGPIALPAGSTFTFEDGVTVEVEAPRAIQFASEQYGGDGAGMAIPVRIVNGSTDVFEPNSSLQFQVAADNVPAQSVIDSSNGFMGTPSNSVLPGGELTFELAYDANGGAILIQVDKDFGEESAFFAATL